MHSSDLFAPINLQQWTFCNNNFHSKCILYIQMHITKAYIFLQFRNVEMGRNDQNKISEEQSEEQGEGPAHWVFLLRFLGTVSCSAQTLQVYLKEKHGRNAFTVIRMALVCPESSHYSNANTSPARISPFKKCQTVSHVDVYILCFGLLLHPLPLTQSKSQ